MIDGDFEIREVVVSKSSGKEERQPYRRVLHRGKQVGLILDARPKEILFTAPILVHHCDELMEWFSAIIGETGEERHPPIMRQEPEHEQENDYDY